LTRHIHYLGHQSSSWVPPKQRSTAALSFLPSHLPSHLLYLGTFCLQQCKVINTRTTYLVQETSGRLLMQHETFARCPAVPTLHQWRKTYSMESNNISKESRTPSPCPKGYAFSAYSSPRYLAGCGIEGVLWFANIISSCRGSFQEQRQTPEAGRLIQKLSKVRHKKHRK
jgi:hypothetical protein